MAYDSLKQVGKYINKSGKDADRSLKRVSPINPKLERVRDVFDDLTPFEMTFYVKDQDERVVLDLFFNLPPPIRGCKVGCIFSKCESFDYTNGNHAVTVQHPYLAGTVSVYLDGEKLDASQMAETNPDGGEVFFQGSSYETVTICYIYSECNEDFNNVCPFTLEPSFAGGLLVFADRFDRAASFESTGGLGYWHQQGFGGGILTPILVSPVGGHYFTGNEGGANYAFEDLRAGGVTQEVLLAVDFGVNNYTSSFQYTFNVTATHAESSFTIFPTSNTVTIARTYRYRDTRITTNGWFFSTQNQSFSIPFPPEAMRTKVFIRFFQTTGILQVKIWPMSEPEPTTWMQHTAAVFPYPSALNSNIAVVEYVENDVIGGRMSGNNYLLAVEHWSGQNSGLYGVWRAEKREEAPGFSWHSTTPAPQSSYDWVNSHPGNAPYFQFGDYGTSPTLTEFQLGNGGLVTQFPNNIYSYVTGFFGPGGPDDIRPNILSGTDHYAVSFDTTIGKPTSYRISGLVKWFMTSATSNIVPHLTVELEAMSYGDQTPAMSGDWIQGDIKQSLFMPMSPADTTELPGAEVPGGGSGWRSASAWTPFEIEIPCSGGSHVQWGARFLETGLQVQDMLGHLAVDSILRTTSVQLTFTRVYTEAVMAPLGPAKELCPAGPLSERCEQIIESFAVPYLIDFDTIPDNDSLTISTTQFTDSYVSENTTWSTTLNYPMVTKMQMSNNIYRNEYRARGITIDGSDGRAPRETNNPNGILATTSATGVGFSSNISATLTTLESPVGCGDFTFSAKFRYGNYVNSWVDGAGVPQTPILQFGILTTTGTTGGQGFWISRIGPSLQISDTTGLISFRNATISQDTWYNLYGEMTSKEGKWKFWPAGTTEPTSWQLAYPRSTTQNNGIVLDTRYVAFVNDGTYIEFTDVEVLSMENAF